jgi:hypothetical protein
LTKASSSGLEALYVISPFRESFSQITVLHNARLSKKLVAL